MVERIEQLRPELQLQLLVNRKALEQRVVQIPQAWVTELIASACTHRARGIHPKRGWVEPGGNLLRLAAAVRLAPVDACQIGEIAAHADERIVYPAQHREGRARLHGEEEIILPSTRNLAK